MPQLINNLLSMHTNISTIFIRTTFRQHPNKAQKMLATTNKMANHANTFAKLNYNIFRSLAFASSNPIYSLILNEIKGLYTHIGHHYFANPKAHSLALDFYHKLSALYNKSTHNQMYKTMHHYRHKNSKIWHQMQKNLPDNLAIQEQ